jgi:hypothetical protein
MNSRKDSKTCVFKINKDGKPYRYVARTTIKTKTHYLGCYKTEQEAVNAYVKFKESLQQQQNKN